MRRLVMISSIVGLFFYTGVITQVGSTVPTSMDLGTITDFGLLPLQDALSAAGASIEQVTITGWIPITDTTVEPKLSRSLGAPGDVQTLTKDGKRFLLVQRVLTGEEISRWAEQAAQVRSAFTQMGIEPVFSVLLMGMTDATDVKSLVKKSLKSLRATQKGSWGNAAAASADGWSPRLWAGPWDVNVQVAARMGGNGGRDRTQVWVGWPSLQKEY